MSEPSYLTHVPPCGAYEFTVDADVSIALTTLTRQKAFEQLRLALLGVDFASKESDPFSSLSRSREAMEAIATLSATGVPVPAITSGCRVFGVSDELVTRLLARHTIQALVQPLTLLRGH